MVSSILVTNDDGVYSIGLKILYDAVERLGDVVIVAPETPKSASGLGITLHKPLRLERIEYWGLDIYTTNGTPSDIVYLALNQIREKIDIVVSGINIGDNTSIQVILSSGTIGAAAQAALMGIPAVAFSADVQEPDELGDPVYAAYLTRITRLITSHILSRGLPEGIDLVSVNYPRRIGPRTRAVIARPAKIKYEQRVEVNVDPHGRRYYWLYGRIVDPEPGTDVYELKVMRNITITPITLDLYPVNTDSIDELRVLEELVTRDLSRSSSG